jgi:multimeric flavodoxin WrbA
MCNIKDELHPYLKLILKSEALVLGTPYQLGRPTGFMDSFLTRLWCFYHIKELLVDKPLVPVSAGMKPKEIQNGIASFENVATHSNQFNLLGHIYYNSQITPCLKCGAGSYCRVGGLWKYILEEDEKKLNNFKLTPDNFKKWEDDLETVKEVDRYGKILSELK